MKCQQIILRGRKAGQKCQNAASMIIVGDGTRTCGVHARAWLPRALARIAYWNPRERAWL